MELQIKQWSQYSNTGQYIVWAPDNALVWMWDANRLQTSLDEHKLTLGRVRIIPETLLHQPHDGGIYLHECMEGFEGQIWHDQALIFNRWWAQIPDSSEWLSFQRDAGVLPEQQLHAVPAPLALAWQEQTWSKCENLGDTAGAGERGELYMLAVGVTALVLVTIWYAANLLKLQQAHETRVAELRALEQRAEPIRLARGQALEELARVSALQSVSLYPDPLSLMAKVAEKLPQNGAYLKEWEYQSGGKLKIMIGSSNKLGSSEYVKSFQAAGLFENVQATASSDPNSIILTMDVTPGAEIKFDDGKLDASVTGLAAQTRADTPAVKTPAKANPGISGKQ